MYIYIYTVHVNHILTIQHLQFISTTPRARASPCACASAQPPPRPLEAASLPRKPVGSRGRPPGSWKDTWDSDGKLWMKSKRIRGFAIEPVDFMFFLKGFNDTRNLDVAKIGGKLVLTWLLGCW